MFLDPADEPQENVNDDPGDFSHAGCSNGECGDC